MVILRSGKNVPFLGKNIPKRNQKKATCLSTQQQISNASTNSENLNTSATTNAMESLTFDSTKYSQIFSCSASNSTALEELELTSNSTIKDASMLSDLDQNTMIDDTLEITNYEDSQLMEHSNRDCMQLHAIEQHNDSTVSFQSATVNGTATTNFNINEMHTTQSNLCGVADLSWF